MPPSLPMLSPSVSQPDIGTIPIDPVLLNDGETHNQVIRHPQRVPQVIPRPRPIQPREGRAHIPPMHAGNGTGIHGGSASDSDSTGGDDDDDDRGSDDEQRISGDGSETSDDEVEQVEDGANSNFSTERHANSASYDNNDRFYDFHDSYVHNPDDDQNADHQ